MNLIIDLIAVTSFFEAKIVRSQSQIMRAPGLVTRNSVEMVSAVLRDKSEEVYHRPYFECFRYAVSSSAGVGLGMTVKVTWKSNSITTPLDVGRSENLAEYNQVPQVLSCEPCGGTFIPKNELAYYQYD